VPTVVAVKFPWGRFHGTPWDSGANEGNPEWPPSPWRILRALLATYHGRRPGLDSDVVGGVLRALAAPPDYRLPTPVAVAHTRHYLPGVADQKSKVFDPFVVVDPEQEVLVRWAAELAGPERAALAQLCDQLAYLGRAEGICDARLVGPEEAIPEDRWASPVPGGSLVSPARRVLAPIEPLDLAALALRTTDVRRARRTIPPGTRWLAYLVTAQEAPASIPTRSPRPPAPSVETVSLALGAAVRPSVRDTVWVAHVARMAALDRHGTPSPTLAGKDEDGRPLSDHRHAHYLPLDLDRDGLLDTLLVWAPGGLRPGDVAALGKIPRLASRLPGFRSVRVALQGAATAEELAPTLVAPAGVARWESLTPFAPYRHQKREPIEEFFAREVSRELEARRLPPASVELVPGQSWLDWRRARPGGRDVRAMGLRLHFATPVSGPISLGNLSHFGLGLFRPASS